MNPVDDCLDLTESNDDDCVIVPVTAEEKKLDNNNKNNSINIPKHPLMAKFINMCLNIDKSNGMKNVIQKFLLDIYTKADTNFVKCKHFHKTLRRAISLIENDPYHRFSHIKDLCEILKYAKIKKRVQLTTLSRNIKVDKTPVPSTTSNGFFIAGEKENNTSFNCSQSSTEEEKLLVPHTEKEFDLTQNTNMEQIKKLELEIAEYKKILAKLDEEEVHFDSTNSPYVKGEKIKEKIVSLYKQLCELTGAEPVKKRMINLNVIDGHPPGAVRRLEKFLNKNIGSDGHPPFPNFRDVVKCVVKANEKEELGYSQQEVMKEAAVLFTHCGRALQKRRQRREWLDLLSKVKRDECDDDPADSDPELLARLQANKRIAHKKETEVLERFTMMQNGAHIKPVLVYSFENQILESKSDRDTSDASSNEEPQETSVLHATTSHNEYDSHFDIKQEPMLVDNIKTPNDSIVKIKKEQYSNIMEKLEQLTGDYTTTVEFEDSFVTVVISDTSDEESS